MSAEANIHAARGVALRAFPLVSSLAPHRRGEGGGEGHGFDLMASICERPLGGMQALSIPTL